MKQSNVFYLGLLVAITSQGCSLTKLDPINEGSAGNGGTSEMGGAGGENVTGGKTTKGGSTAKGGSITKISGGPIGGETSLGGTSNSGGFSNSGGVTATGGTSSVVGTTGGGAPIIGGSSSTGGASTATGGKTSAGGTSSVGGTSSIGGAGTGGVTTATGGKTSGGTSATGGSTTIPPTGRPFIPVTNSCQGLATPCQGESCCTSIAIPGGTFPMGASASTSGSDYDPAAAFDTFDAPEHQATLSAFALDKYEVTVGRFRKFVGDYNSWHVTAGNPTTGSGQHPIAGRTGWGQSWQVGTYDLPENKDALTTRLKCNSSIQTWQDNLGTITEESYPINCIDWFVAFAFCIWDGGRLPTEAEWEYAAAGGIENRLYPWGASTPAFANVNYIDSDNTPRVVVGNKTAGKGYFGHLDLAGSLYEWSFDWYHAKWYGNAGVSNPCINCANSTELVRRIIRGGNFSTGAYQLVVAVRGAEYPTVYSTGSGIRCARNP